MLVLVVCNLASFRRALYNSSGISKFLLLCFIRFIFSPSYQHSVYVTFAKIYIPRRQKGVSQQILMKQNINLDLEDLSSVSWDRTPRHAVSLCVSSRSVRSFAGSIGVVVSLRCLWIIVFLAQNRFLVGSCGHSNDIFLFHKRLGISPFNIYDSFAFPFR